MTYAPVENFLHSMKDEAPRWFNPITKKEEAIPIFVSGKGEPINKPIGPIGTYKGGEEIKPIDPYKGGATVELLGNIISDLFNTARGRDVNKRDYDKLQERNNEKYFNSPQINPKGTDPFAPPIRLAMGVPYTLPDQQIFYETGGKVHQMSKPIKDDYDLKRLMDTMNRRYGIRATNPMPSFDYQIAQEYPNNVWDEDDSVLLDFLERGGLPSTIRTEDAINKLIERRGSA